MEGLTNSNVCENEAYYPSSHKNTWQLEERLPTNPAEAYISSISHKETIKVEEIEDEEGENVFSLINTNDCCYSGMLMTDKGDVPVIKKENFICNTSLTVKRGYNEESSKVKWFPCDKCEISNNNGNFSQHSLIHDGLKPFQCDKCDKSFTEKGNLNKHKLLHEGIKHFECDICEIKFTRKDALKIHKLLHEGVKPFGCDTCEIKFTRKGDLNQHKRLHEGIKPFECEICEKRFALKHDLNQHKAIHESMKPFGCAMCERRFTAKSSLNRHKLTHEGISAQK